MPGRAIDARTLADFILVHTSTARTALKKVDLARVHSDATFLADTLPSRECAWATFNTKAAMSRPIKQPALLEVGWRCAVRTLLTAAGAEGALEVILGARSA